MRFFGLGFFMESSPPWALVVTLKEFFFQIFHGVIQKKVMSAQCHPARTRYPCQGFGVVPFWFGSGSGAVHSSKYDLKGQCNGIFETYTHKSCNTVSLKENKICTYDSESDVILVYSLKGLQHQIFELFFFINQQCLAPQFAPVEIGTTSLYTDS